MNTASTPTKSGEHRNVMVWSSKNKITMALICWTAGMSNCWGFPFTYMNNQGFLLQYLILTVFIGVPLTFMELGIAQFSSKGPIAMWALFPLLKGVGYANIVILAIYMAYYNVLCSYALYYAAASLSSSLPWTHCNPSWAKQNCYSFAENASIRMACNEKYGSTYCNNLTWEHSGVQFWKNNVLNLSRTALHGSLQSIRLSLMYCSLVTAFLVFLINCQGTKSIEKVICTLTVLPYVEIFLLLFVTLIGPGSLRGIKQFLTINLSDLSRMKPWTEAFEHILLSLGLGLGGLQVLGSQHHFRNSVQWDSIIINIVDSLTSICLGIVVYNALGALSYGANVPLDTFLAWPSHLLFGTIPYAFSYILGLPQIWSILFYTCVYVLGLRSQVLMMAAVLSVLYEHHPKAAQRTILFSAVGSFIMFVSGYPYLTESGSFVISAIEVAIRGPVLSAIVFCELLGILCVYGLTHFMDDVHFMLGFRPAVCSQIVLALNPFVVGLFFCYGSYYMFTTPLGLPHIVLKAAQGTLCIIPWFLIFVFIVYRLVRNRRQNVSVKLLKPSPTWGPPDPILRKSREMFSAHSMTKEYMYRQTRLKDKTRAYNTYDDSKADAEFY